MARGRWASKAKNPLGGGFFRGFWVHVFSAHWESMTAPRTCYTLTRTGQMSTNPSVLMQGLGVALANLTSRGPATLLVHRTSEALSSYIMTGSSHEEETAAIGLARSLGARADTCDEPQFRSPTDQIVQLRVSARQHLDYGATLAGADPAAIIDQISLILEEDSWVALVVRKPSRLEKNRYATFVRTMRAGQIQHYSKQSAQPVVAAVYAGASDTYRARRIIDSLVGSWVGFDVDTRTSHPSVVPALGAWLLGGAACLTLHVTGILDPYVPHPYLVWAAGFFALIGMCVGRGLIPTRATRLRRTLPPPPHRSVPASKGRRAGVDKEGNPIEARDPSYPLHACSVLLSPIMAATFLSPQAGAESGATQTFHRPPPPSARARQGAFVGLAEETPTYVCDEDAGLGMAIFGSPGSGKSVFLQGMAAYLFGEQAHPSRRPKAPGAHNSVIIFEIKPDGAKAYVEVHRTVTQVVGHSPNPLWYINVADPTCPNGIDLFGPGATAEDKAALLTDALVYASADGEIGSASREALMTSLRAAQFVDETVLSNAQAHKNAPLGAFTPGSFVHYAHILLTGMGDEAGNILATELRKKLMDGTAYMLQCAAALDTLYGKTTPAQRRDATKAPRNKIARLASLDHLFLSANKPSWEWILTNAHNVVILTSGQHPHVLSDDEETLVTAIFTYTLQRTVQAHCAGWDELGWYHTPIFDEVSTIGKDSPQILDWWRNKGRSYGARPIYATQYPSQLHPDLRRTMQTFPVFVSFKADDSVIATEIAARLGADGQEWSGPDLINLPRYEAAISASSHGQSQPTFTASTVWWKSDPQAYIGYATL